MSTKDSEIEKISTWFEGLLILFPRVSFPGRYQKICDLALKFMEKNNFSVVERAKVWQKVFYLK